MFVDEICDLTRMPEMGLALTVSWMVTEIRIHTNSSLEIDTQADDDLVIVADNKK